MRANNPDCCHISALICFPWETRCNDGTGISTVSFCLREEGLGRMCVCGTCISGWSLGSVEDYNKA